MLSFKKYLLSASLLCSIYFPSVIQADLFQDIRAKYAYTNENINSFTTKEYFNVFLSDDINESNFSYEAKNIFQLALSNITVSSNNEYTKIILTFDSRGEDQISEYYYFKGNIYFVYKVITEYSKNKDEDNFLESNKKILQNRYYFDNQKMIRWINNDKHQVDSTSKQYKESAKQILHDSKVYFQLTSN
jgi:hypothetical protein